MTSKGKISTVQMFSVLFLSRIIALFTFMLPSASYIPSGDRILTAVPVMIFEFIYAAVLISTLRKNEGKSIIEAAGTFSPFLSKVLAVIYSLSFIIFAGIGTARFELFISTVIFPNSELTLMITILLLACFYASLKGIEAIGRASVIITAILGTSIVFILLSVTGEFSFSNLKPVFTEGLTPILGFSFYVSARAAELLTLHISAPVIKGNIKKMLFSWIVVFAVTCSIILLYLSGVTGEYGDDQIFPLYTLTVIAKFGIFERLDDILTGLWVLCCFIQVSYILSCCMLALSQGFGKIKKVPVAAVCTPGIFAVYILTSSTVTVFSEIISSQFFDIMFISLALVIPSAITVICILRKKKRKTI